MLVQKANVQLDIKDDELGVYEGQGYKVVGAIPDKGEAKEGKGDKPLTEHQQLIAKAKELGLTFPAAISSAKLKILIDEAEKQGAIPDKGEETNEEGGQ